MSEGGQWHVLLEKDDLCLGMQRKLGYFFTLFFLGDPLLQNLLQVSGTVEL